MHGAVGLVKERWVVAEDEELLLTVLNSAPVIDGLPTDALSEPGAGAWTRALGGRHE